jgi:DNA-binding NarL/FixJ family response regulator
VFEVIEVVAEGGTGEDAIRICRDIPVDVILLDIKIPGISRQILIASSPVPPSATTSITSNTAYNCNDPGTDQFLIINNCHANRVMRH